MGGNHPGRQRRLRSLRETPAGWLRLATCTACGYQATLPVPALIRQHGELAIVEFALNRLRCSACGGYGASESMVRICDPGCPRRTVGGARVAAE